ncbi:glycosyltransferase [Tropicimonas sp. IMCC34011]|uniref:glycosyltransferase n=1 Tax=Tropicimonas sp. IMCC34011 TaxID=2248759 RepID=UPI001E55FDE8|nr:glycosyltransferase [Tropicimonas sp. IMCC34011]
MSNNGLRDHIGQAQVLPYLSGLAARGHSMSVLSVEQTADRGMAGLDIGTLNCHQMQRRTGYGRLADRLLVAPRLARRLDGLVREVRPDILHCRSYMPLSSALNTAGRHGAKLIFDMRGFWIDERIEGGMWDPKGLTGRLLIRHFRALEDRAYAEAAAIVVLTHDAKRVVEAQPAYRGAPISVIPCSVDQERFGVHPALRAATRTELGLSTDTPVILYLGSASPLYRMHLLYRFFDAVRARSPEVRLMLVGNHDAQEHAKAAARHGVTLAPGSLICRRVAHHEVPAMLNAADLGISFRIQSPSSLGVSATKVGEYLACGLPVASSTGIGDIRRIIAEGENGMILADDSDAEIDRCAARFLSGFSLDRPGIKARSGDYFSMDTAVGTYDMLYRDLAR